jgi:hypothetical protein
MTSDTTDIITAMIPRFREISGIGRSKIYIMLDASELESVHAGARRLILVDSCRRLPTRLQAEGKDGASRRPRPADPAPPAAERHAGSRPDRAGDAV